MAVLDSTSTMAQIDAEIADTISYREDADIAKCRRFITAVELKSLRLSQSAADGSRMVSNDLGHYRELAREAKEWLARHGGEVVPSTSRTATTPVLHVPEAFR